MHNISLFLLIGTIAHCTNGIDFAAYQFNLISNQHNTGLFWHYTISATFPTPYNSSYNRYVVLSGFHISNTNDIDLLVYLSDPTSDSTDAIQMLAYYPTIFFELWMMIVLVKSDATWIWVEEVQHSYQFLNQVSNGILKQNISVTFPTVTISPEADYGIRLFLSSYRSIGRVGSDNRAYFEQIAIVPPSTVVFSGEIPYSDQQIFNSKFIVIMYHIPSAQAQKLGQFSSKQQTWGSYDNIVAPVTFSIPDSFGYSSAGGFNGNCLVAFTKLYLYGNAVSDERTIKFDLRTNPFSDFNITMPITPSGFEQGYFIRWGIMCFMECYQGTYYEAQLCHNCMLNCIQCQNGTNCEICNSTFGVNSDQTACVSCTVLTSTCSECLNSTYCSLCLNDSFALSGNSCEACSFFINNCTLCSSSSTCTQCADYFTVLGSGCYLCSLMIQNCSLCENSSFCLECFNTSFLNASNLCDSCLTNLDYCVFCSNATTCLSCFNYSFAIGANNTCELCPNLMDNCQLCESAFSCLSCNNTEVAVSINKICQPCSTLISNCLLCSSSEFCLECISDSFSLYSSGNSSQICLPCSVSLPNCIMCSSSSNCTACLNSMFFVDGNQRCSLCSSVLINCTECSASAGSIQPDCSLCQSTYFVNSSNQCQICTSAMNFCALCSNGTSCEACISNLYLFSETTGNCELCSTSFPNCLQCNRQYCTLCPPEMYLATQNQACACIEGNLVTGLCTTVAGCTSVVLGSGGSQICLSCNSASFNTTPVNGVCLCLRGNLTNGACVEDGGCLSPLVLEDGSVLCEFCNISAGFQLRVNSLGQCQCEAKLFLSGQTCIEICGDGFLLSGYECDDGNLDDGDGCSSLCSVEPSFRCAGGSSASPSVCVYSGVPLTMSLSSIRRAEERDQGIFRFEVFPPIFSISKMHLNQHVGLDCNASYKVSQLSYLNGVLEIRASYTSDMEGQNCTVTFSFDQQIIRSPTIHFNFSAVSENTPLKISSYSREYYLLNIIFFTLSIAVLVVFILGLPQKMIGAELLSCSQFVYLSNAFYEEPTFLFSSVKNFRLVVGSWSLFHQPSDEDLLLPFSQRFELTGFFLKDNLILIIVIFVVLTTFLTLKVISVISGQNYESDQKKNKQGLCHGFQKGLYNFLLFPFVLGFFVVLNVSGFITCIRLNQEKSPQLGFINSLALLFIFTAFGLVFFECSLLVPIQKKRQEKEENFGSFEDARRWYIPFFIIKLIVMTTFLEIGIFASFKIMNYAIASVSAISLVIFVLLRPYNRIVDNLRIIFCEFAILYASLLPLLHRFIEINEIYELFIIYILQSLVFLSLCFTVIKIIIFYCSLGQNCKKGENLPDILLNSKNGKKEGKRFEERELREAKKMHEYSPFQNSAVKRQLKDNQNSLAQKPNQCETVTQKGDQKGLEQVKARLRDTLLKKKKKQVNQF